MSIEIGEVIAVQGLKITLKIFETSSKDTLFYNGKRFKGVSIHEYISIQRGFRDIICTVEGEYLDERKFEPDGDKINYIRKVEAKPIGYFENGSFFPGIKFLPIIKDKTFLLEENKISEIFSIGNDNQFQIGKTLKADIPISLPWEKLFNSHIGIFGNTGSGKSNTLAKIYTVLFDKKLENISGKSKFTIIDFNGEYTKNQLINDENDKTVIKLDTKSNSNGDKFPLAGKQFWDIETLSILFQATTNTQRPFLNRVINGWSKYAENQDSLLKYITSTFEKVFTSTGQKAEALDLLKRIASIVKADELVEELKKIEWHASVQKFHIKESYTFFNGDVDGYKKNNLSKVVNGLSVNDLNNFDELIIRIYIQLTRDLIQGYVQYDHIQPLLKRAEASISTLEKVIEIVVNNPPEKTLTVISLRNCNQDIKKVLPLLIAKQLYKEHKKDTTHRPDKTRHLIIDEAHNILSQQSSSERESWKDYRLELFEEIIKEGRKFGMFLTLSSQRPADISPTIISQVHNFFIHRLVNERDLYLLENTLSTVDSKSRSLTPNLPKGSCILTGTAFELPILIQIDQLPSEQRPDSEDVDLTDLWGEQN